MYFLLGNLLAQGPAGNASRGRFRKLREKFPKVSPTRTIELPDGTPVYNLPVPLLGRAEELALPATSCNHVRVVRILNPEWQPIYEWCWNVGHCVAPRPSEFQVSRCVCGLPPRT